MVKKLSVSVLMTMLIMILAFPATYFAVALPEGATGFWESFDQMPTGNLTNGNGLTGYTYTNGSVSIVEVPDSVNKSLKLLDNDFVAGSEYRFGVSAVKEGFGGLNGKIVFETRYKIIKVDGYIPSYSIELFAGSLKVARFLQYSSRSYGIKTFSDDNAYNYVIPGGTTGPEVPIDQWITLKMQIDTISKTYDLIVQTDSLKGYTGAVESQATLDKATGTFKKTGIPLYGSYTGTDITKIMIYSNNYKGEMYFDYLAMYKLPDSPEITLTAPIDVKGSDEFYVDLGLKNAINAKAEDITMTYNTNLFEFSGAEGSVIDQVYGTVVNEVYNNSGSGIARLILSSPGAGNALNGDVQIGKIKFKAKSISGTGSIAVTNAIVADDKGVETIIEALAGVNISVADKSSLLQLLNSVNNEYNSAQEGIEDGKFIPGMLDRLKSDLQQAIASAQSVLDNSSATLQQIDDAFNNLSTAINVFESKKIKPTTGDINNSQKVSIGDIAIMAGYYGKISTDADWSDAKVADINEDGSIDISDLGFVSKRVMLLN